MRGLHSDLKTTTQNAVEITEKMKGIGGVIIAGVVFLGVIAFVMLADLMIKISVEP